MGNGIAVDSIGNVYVTGWTESYSFPVQNAFQEIHERDGGKSDVFVTKLSADGELIYSTYIGGDRSDVGNGIAVDSIGNVYVTGWTESRDFPVRYAFQESHGGHDNEWMIDDDVFVTKLSSHGDLLYSTYLGGSHDDAGKGIAVDGVGNAYVTGNTQSKSFLPFPVLNAFQENHGGRDYSDYWTNYDAFVTKLSANGELMYSTYLGGTSDNRDDSGAAIAVDSAGNAYVTGNTQSKSFPVQNAFQETNAHWTRNDAFVTKLSADGGLMYSTYLGGNDDDGGSGVAVDSAGNAYVTGWTESRDFPIQNAFQVVHGGKGDAFVAKIFIEPFATSEFVDLWYSGDSGSHWIYSTPAGGRIAMTVLGDVEIGNRTYRKVIEDQQFVGLGLASLDPFLVFRRDNTHNRMKGYAVEINRAFEESVLEYIESERIEGGLRGGKIQLEHRSNEWTLFETLEVGQRWRVMEIRAYRPCIEIRCGAIAGFNGGFTIEAFIPRTEIIESSAGEFKTFVIEYDMVYYFSGSVRGPKRESLCTMWLAPDVGLVQLEVDGNIIGTLSEYHIGGEQFPSSAFFVYSPQLEQFLTGQEITFEAGQSKNIVAYEWDFGDGRKDIGPIVHHHFQGKSDESSTYNVTLTVRDDAGYEDTYKESITVIPIDKTAEIAYKPTVGEQTTIGAKVWYNWIGTDQGKNVYKVSKIDDWNSYFVGYYDISIENKDGVLWSRRIIATPVRGEPYAPEQLLIAGDEDWLSVKAYGVTELELFSAISIILGATGVQTGPVTSPLFVESTTTYLAPDYVDTSGFPAIDGKDVEFAPLTMAHIGSPAELRIYDSQGRVTGLIGGEVKQGIPDSAYFNDTIVILSAESSFRYEVVGTEEGEYDLGVLSVEGEESNAFITDNIPISPSEIHQYSIDWVALTKDEEGVTVKIDEDGDLVPERTIASDSELTQDEYLFAIAVNPKGKYPTSWSEVKRTQLFQNYPNPFNPETWIPYALAEQTHVVINIYIATGQLIRTLDLGKKPAGIYLSRDKAIRWDGRDDNGESVASGVYFYTLEAGDYIATKKMIIAK